MQLSRNQKLALFAATIFVVMFLLSKPIFRFMNGIENKQEFIDSYDSYRYYFMAALILFNSAFAWICSKMAKKRGKDSGRWAKNGFLFTIWAAAWLYFSDEE